MTSAVQHHPEAVSDLLIDWLPRQRWFGAKQRQISHVRPVRTVTLHDGGADGPYLEHMVVAVGSSHAPGDHGASRAGDGVNGEPVAEGGSEGGSAGTAPPEGTEQLYQLLIGVRPDLPERLEHARIGLLDNRHWAYDAVHDSDLTSLLLDLIGANAEVDGMRFTREPGVQLTTGLPGRAALAEQSNSSLIYADKYILKLFRKLGMGRSPDLELHRALRRAGSGYIADPFGAIEGELDGQPVTFGLLQKFFANCADGWAMAITSIRDLIAEADLRADEVGGDFAAEADRLGQAVASVHADLAATLGVGEVPAERIGSVVAGMQRRLDDVLRRMSALAPYEGPIREAFAALEGLGRPVEIQRIHGDLHLGQALRTVSHWVLIDFEGEPAKPLADRVAMMSPLRDVAGMLRSFDYAAHHLLVDHEPDAQLEYRAQEWIDRNREAFCDGYAKGGGTDPRAHPVLMRALELDKAVYEIAYEQDNRPNWVEIPLRSIARIAG